MSMLLSRNFSPTLNFQTILCVINKIAIEKFFRTIKAIGRIKSIQYFKAIQQSSEFELLSFFLDSNACQVKKK